MVPRYFSVVVVVIYIPRVLGMREHRYIRMNGALNYLI